MINLPKLKILKITFLGTGTSQGIPVIGSKHPVCLSKDYRDKRLRVSVLVQWGECTYVIDCSPDFRQQMLTHNVEKLNGILFTHEHADHTMGLDDIRPYFFNQGEIPIYAHKRVITDLERRFSYIFQKENKYPGAPSVKAIEVKNNYPFILHNKKVVPINALHNTLQVFGYRIDKFAYLTDVKTIEQEEINKLKGVEILVINALRREQHISHFNLEEAIAFVQEVQPKKAYFTHISHLMGFHAEVQQNLPKNVFLAYDNLELQI